MKKKRMVRERLLSVIAAIMLAGLSGCSGEVTERITEIEADMVKIPGGTFSMGCVSGQDCRDSEKPVHRVTVGSFYLSKYETTVGQFKVFVEDTGHDMGKCDWSEGKSWRSPDFSQSDNQPVVCVNWNDAVAYAKWLSGKTGEVWRLPTEAEWEYAARGDKDGNNRTRYSWGNGISCSKAAYNGGKGSSCDWKKSNGDFRGTKSVGSFSANGFGVHDMHGNVWEWVSDWKGRYKSGSQTDPKGPQKGSRRVYRGGSWDNNARNLRSANRSNNPPGSRYDNLGFRLLRQPW